MAREWICTRRSRTIEKKTLIIIFLCIFLTLTFVLLTTLYSTSEMTQSSPNARSVTGIILRSTDVSTRWETVTETAVLTKFMYQMSHEASATSHTTNLTTLNTLRSPGELQSEWTTPSTKLDISTPCSCKIITVTKYISCGMETLNSLPDTTTSLFTSSESIIQTLLPSPEVVPSISGTITPLPSPNAVSFTPSQQMSTMWYESEVVTRITSLTTPVLPFPSSSEMEYSFLTDIISASSVFFVSTFYLGTITEPVSTMYLTAKPTSTSASFGTSITPKQSVGNQTMIVSPSSINSIFSYSTILPTLSSKTQLLSSSLQEISNITTIPEVSISISNTLLQSSRLTSPETLIPDITAPIPSTLMLTHQETSTTDLLASPSIVFSTEKLKSSFEFSSILYLSTPPMESSIFDKSISFARSSVSLSTLTRIVQTQSTAIFTTPKVMTSNVLKSTISKEPISVSPSSVSSHYSETDTISSDEGSQILYTSATQTSDVLIATTMVITPTATVNTAQTLSQTKLSIFSSEISTKLSSSNHPSQIRTTELFLKTISTSEDYPSLISTLFGSLHSSSVFETNRPGKTLNINMTSTSDLVLYTSAFTLDYVTSSLPTYSKTQTWTISSNTGSTNFYSTTPLTALSETFKLPAFSITNVIAPSDITSKLFVKESSVFRTSSSATPDLSLLVSSPINLSSRSSDVTFYPSLGSTFAISTSGSIPNSIISEPFVTPSTFELTTLRFSEGVVSSQSSIFKSTGLFIPSLGPIETPSSLKSSFVVTSAPCSSLTIPTETINLSIMSTFGISDSTIVSSYSESISFVTDSTVLLTTRSSLESFADPKPSFLDSIASDSLKTHISGSLHPTMTPAELSTLDVVETSLSTSLQTHISARSSLMKTFSTHLSISSTSALVESVFSTVLSSPIVTEGSSFVSEIMPSSYELIEPMPGASSLFADTSAFLTPSPSLATSPLSSELSVLDIFTISPSTSIESPFTSESIMPTPAVSSIHVTSAFAPPYTTPTVSPSPTMVPPKNKEAFIIGFTVAGGFILLAFILLLICCCCIRNRPLKDQATSVTGLILEDNKETQVDVPPGVPPRKLTSTLSIVSLLETSTTDLSTSTEDLQPNDTDEPTSTPSIVSLVETSTTDLSISTDEDLQPSDHDEPIFNHVDNNRLPPLRKVNSVHPEIIPPKRTRNQKPRRKRPRKDKSQPSKLQNQLEEKRRVTFDTDDDHQVPSEDDTTAAIVAIVTHESEMRETAPQESRAEMPGLTGKEPIADDSMASTSPSQKFVPSSEDESRKEKLQRDREIRRRWAEERWILYRLIDDAFNLKVSSFIIGREADDVEGIGKKDRTSSANREIDQRTSENTEQQETHRDTQQQLLQTQTEDLLRDSVV